jgi:hypothetical protein
MWDHVFSEDLPDTVVQEIGKGETADFASLSPSDRCKLNFALYSAILVQPEERQLRLIPALAPKPSQ